MFKELDDNLASIEVEVNKLKTAVTHIAEAKEAAGKVVEAAETMNKEFKGHLQKVTKAVDTVLEPHKELIEATENLIKTIESVDFPKQLKLIKSVVISSSIVALIGTLVILYYVILIA